MKFYEVTSQFILTSHVIGYDMLAVSKKAWANLKPVQQAKFRAQADRIFDANAAKYDLQEQETIEFFRSEGKQVYTPDQNAFRAFAQKRYLDKYSSEWPKGAIERINAVR
jgi:TRAP-type transport system periplasmic protein